MGGVLDLYGAHPMWLWAAFAAGLLAIEVLTGSGWLLWASASAGATAIAVGVFHVPLEPAVLTFAVLTLVTTLTARRYVPRSATAHAGDINDNIARLVGHTGWATQGFAGGSGRVFIDGKEWPAELDEGSDPPAEGDGVKVMRVMGTRLKVRRVG